MSVAGDGAAASDAASGSDVFMLYVCYLDDSDLNSISPRPRPFPIFYAMQTTTGIADSVWSEGQIFFAYAC